MGMGKKKSVMLLWVGLVVMMVVVNVGEARVISIGGKEIRFSKRPKGPVPPSGPSGVSTPDPPRPRPDSLNTDPIWFSSKHNTPVPPSGPSGRRSPGTPPYSPPPPRFNHLAP
ncbi:hypothetical protein TorRG33x02_014190 [Trema orientale]|uniref:Transmembrane protein n=1 Tax=Trema orientale TaxID=63057 RepID=A0A2P5FXD6_TREOI|nr:hypothetical protein TorRG33x02_014190 [Trema orientale]